MSLGMRTALPKHEVTRGITCRSLACRMQGLEKPDKRGSFRRAQVFSVSRHVSASLNDLADKLVLREAHSNAVERRASLSAEFAERVAIAALLGLKDECPLSLKSGGAM